MDPFLTNYTLAAGEVKNLTTTATRLTVKIATLPVNFQTNGGPNQLVSAGTVLPIQPGQIAFSNPNAVSVTVSFWLADREITFSPADSSGSNAKDALFGNCGIANGATVALPNDAAGTTNITCDGNGFLTIPNTPNILIPGTRNGLRRQTITFSLKSTGTVSLNVLDPDKNTYITIAPGGPPVQITTGSDLYVSGVGAGCLVTIGQQFLTGQTGA